MPDKSKTKIRRDKWSYTNSKPKEDAMNVANKGIFDEIAQTNQKEQGIPLLMLQKHDPLNYLSKRKKNIDQP
jgi:hypothetical protein